MGAFDDGDNDLESSPRSRSSSFNMLGRGLGDARRKIILLLLLGGFFILSLVAFRRQEQIKDIIEDQRQHWTNTPLPATKSIIKPAEPSAIEEQDDRNDSVVDKQSPSVGEQKKPLSEKRPVLPGPRSRDRSLSDASLVDLRNETLGVRVNPRISFMMKGGLLSG